MAEKPLRLAATSDIHYGRHTRGKCRELFEHASQVADVLAICGDLTDYGLPEEAQILVEDLHSFCRIPVVAVLGNHDFESGHTEEVARILEAAGVNLLDGECFEFQGVGFAGVCGFGGGFDRRMLNAWGEPAIKNFVQEAVDQGLKLERALARLSTPHRVALLHYAPTRATVVGEDPEIFPFLGSTRLEAPLNRYAVTLAFHGHAHNGTYAGKTEDGVPVYNVALPLLRRDFPHQPGFVTFDLHTPATVENSAGTAPHEVTDPVPVRIDPPSVPA